MVFPEGLHDWKDSQHHGQKIISVRTSLHLPGRYNQCSVFNAAMIVMNSRRVSTELTLECRILNQ